MKKIIFFLSFLLLFLSLAPVQAKIFDPTRFEKVILLRGYKLSVCPVDLGSDLAAFLDNNASPGQFRPVTLEKYFQRDFSLPCQGENEDLIIALIEVVPKGEKPTGQESDTIVLFDLDILRANSAGFSYDENQKTQDGKILTYQKIYSFAKTNPLFPQGQKLTKDTVLWFNYFKLYEPLLFLNKDDLVKFYFIDKKNAYQFVSLEKKIANTIIWENPYKEYPTPEIEATPPPSPFPTEQVLPPISGIPIPFILTPTPTTSPPEIDSFDFQELQFGKTVFDKISPEDKNSPIGPMPGKFDAYKITIPEEIKNINNLLVYFTSCLDNTEENCYPFSAFYERMLVFHKPQGLFAKLYPQFSFNTRFDLGNISLPEDRTYYILVGNDDSAYKKYGYYRLYFGFDKDEINFKPLYFGTKEFYKLTDEVSLTNPFTGISKVETYTFKTDPQLDFKNIEIRFVSCPYNPYEMKPEWGNDCTEGISFNEVIYILDEDLKPIPGQYHFNTRLSFDNYNIVPNKTYYLLVGSEENLSLPKYFSISYRYK